jgi:hypothetical protein
MKMPSSRVVDSAGNPTAPWLHYFNQLTEVVALTEAEDIDVVTAELLAQEDLIDAMEETFTGVDQVYSQLIFANVVLAKCYHLTHDQAEAKVIEHNIFAERSTNIVRQNQAYIYDDDDDGEEGLEALYGPYHYHYFGWVTGGEADFASLYTAFNYSTDQDPLMVRTGSLLPALISVSGGGELVRANNQVTFTQGTTLSQVPDGSDRLHVFFIPWFRGHDAD